MALTIKGIEAAKPKANKKTGKQIPVKLSDGNGVMLFVTSQNKIWRARYFYMGKEQNLTHGKDDKDEMTAHGLPVPPLRCITQS